MAAKNVLPRCTAPFNRIPRESSRIRNLNAVHLGKKFLAAIFNIIVYRKILSRNDQFSLSGHYFKSHNGLSLKGSVIDFIFFIRGSPSVRITDLQGAMVKLTMIIIYNKNQYVELNRNYNLSK